FSQGREEEEKPGDLRPGLFLRVGGAGMSYHGLRAGTRFLLPPREVLFSTPVCRGRSPAGSGLEEQSDGRERQQHLIGRGEAGGGGGGGGGAAATGATGEQQYRRRTGR
ncbi:unnamed protein product, partial [Ectocarpus sp. 13 AM-2016]